MRLSVSIDGKPVGTFKSAGIAHDTKSLVSLTTNRVDVNYDDFSIKGVREALTHLPAWAHRKARIPP